MRILLADDHPVVRRLVRNILETEEGWEVCAEARNGREAVTMSASEHPDVVVLDLSMPGLSGLEAAKRIHEHDPEMKMLVLSMHDPVELMDQLKECGVRKCVLKTDLQDLVDAIRDVWQPIVNASECFSDRPTQGPTIGTETKQTIFRSPSGARTV